MTGESQVAIKGEERVGAAGEAKVRHPLLRLSKGLGELFRKKRLAWFESTFPTASYRELIDVGGTFDFWKTTLRNVTIVNPNVPPCSEGRVTSIGGNGTRLPFPDKFFRLAFSNSAIEHMHNYDEMKQFASELSRVGIALYCQTPNRWFFFDVHYLVFFLHWLPNLLRNYFVVRYLTGWGWVLKPDREMVKAWAGVVNLLSEREFKALFPDCTIRHEKFLWMTKSFIAIRIDSTQDPKFQGRAS
jgi:methyltransferase family protein